MQLSPLPGGVGGLAGAVAVAVRDAVSTGHLVPGETYSVYQLAEQLAVSRSPVREALLRLAEAGLVEIRKNRGFQVLRPDRLDIEEIFDIRRALEPPAAARAARDGSDAALAELAGVLHHLERAHHQGDETAFWTSDRALHDALLLAAGRRRTARVVAALRETTSLLGPPSTATGRSLAEILDEHRPIVAAVLARDPAAAEAAMDEHLQRTCALLIDGR